MNCDFMYKCRLCGEEFWPAGITGVPYRVVEEMLEEGHIRSFKMLYTHICNDFQCGVADFIGVRDNESLKAIEDKYAAT